MNNNQKEIAKKEKKLKREKRIVKQRLLQKEALIKETKEKANRDKLQHQTRQKQTPIVNTYDNILERNIEILEEAMAKQDALNKFREENREQIKENV